MQISRQGGFSTPMDGDDLLAMWAFSPLACPPAAVEEMLADLQTLRPTAMIALNVGPVVCVCIVDQVRQHALKPFRLVAEKPL